MDEGTKIGNKNDSELELEKFKPSSSRDELTPTKIGDVSDFEKSLFTNENQEVAIEQEAESTSANDKNSTEVKDQESTEITTKQPVEQASETAKEMTNKPSVQKNELELLMEAEMQKSVFDFQEGDVIEGSVRVVEKAGVIIDFNYKSDGYIVNAELGYNDDNETEKLIEGQKVLVYIEKLETKEGYSLLSRKKAQYEESWDNLLDAYESKSVLTIDVVSRVMGGLVTSYRSIRGFIPASQLNLEEGEDLDVFVGKKLEVNVIQADRRRRKIIFSNKFRSKNLQSSSIDKILEEIEIGETRVGKVTSIKDFGVFVDIGGAEGLVHISELSWLRVSHPSDVVENGQEVKVFILGVDKKTKKISLGMKQLEADPWVTVGNKYQVGQVIEGTITRLVAFGAFIKIEDQLEGLIHISEMSNERIERVEDKVKPGDIVKAKIIKLLIDEQKIGLTLKNIDTVDQAASEQPSEPDITTAPTKEVDSTEEAQTIE